MSYTELKSKPVTVRKPRCCAWCAQRIAAGEDAQYRAYVFDGELNADWMHPECHKAMIDYPDQSELIDGWTPGEFERPSAATQPKE